MLMLVTQIVLGAYLKLHLEKGIHSRVRKYVVGGHGVLGKLMPVVSWVQMLFGGITAMGYCREDHLGQCLAHFIMGSAFIGYGIVMTILLLVGTSMFLCQQLVPAPALHSSVNLPTALKLQDVQYQACTQL